MCLCSGSFMCPSHVVGGATTNVGTFLLPSVLRFLIFSLHITFAGTVITLLYGLLRSV